MDEFTVLLIYAAKLEMAPFLPPYFLPILPPASNSMVLLLSPLLAVLLLPPVLAVLLLPLHPGHLDVNSWVEIMAIILHKEGTVWSPSTCWRELSLL